MDAIFVCNEASPGHRLFQSLALVVGPLFGQGPKVQGIRGQRFGKWAVATLPKFSFPFNSDCSSCSPDSYLLCRLPILAMMSFFGSSGKSVLIGAFLLTFEVSVVSPGFAIANTL